MVLSSFMAYRPSESSGSICTIRILPHPGQRCRTREEEGFLDFLRRNWEFFAGHPDLLHPEPEAIGVLWPNMA
jgi:hypothetical protein